MTTITYAGETATTWRGRVFQPGLAVAVDPVADAAMIEKARHMPAFTVAEPVASVDMDDLRAQAAELGIKVHHRWGAERLQAAIDKALEA